MNELEYQLDLSDTLDSGNVTGQENDDELYRPNDENTNEQNMQSPVNVIMLSESDGGPQKVAKHFDDFHVQLCQSCSSSMPLVSLPTDKTDNTAHHIYINEFVSINKSGSRF